MLAWDFLLSVAAYFGLLLRPFLAGANLTTACLLPLAVVLFRPLVLSHFIALVALGLCFAMREPTYCFFPLLVFGIALSTAFAGDRRRAVQLLALAVILGGFVLLPVPPQENARQALLALFRAPEPISKLFGWTAPDFQAVPELAAAIAGLVICAYLSGPIFPERMGMYLSTFLLLVLSVKSAPYLVLAFSVALYETLRRIAAETGPTLKEERTLLMALFLCAVPFLYRVPSESLVEARIREAQPALAAYAESIRSSGGRLHLMHRPGLGGALARAGLPVFAAAAPLGDELSALPKLDVARLQEAIDVFTLGDGWESILQSEQINAVMLERREPLAGVLISGRHWRVLSESTSFEYSERSLSKQTSLVVLVPGAD